MYRPISTNQNLNRPTFIPEELENVGADKAYARNKYQSVELVDRDTFSALKYGIAHEMQQIDREMAKRIQSDADKTHDLDKIELAKRAQSAAAHHEREELQKKEAQVYNIDLDKVDMKQARLIQSEADKHPGSVLKSSHLKEKAQQLATQHEKEAKLLEQTRASQAHVMQVPHSLRETPHVQNEPTIYSTVRSKASDMRLPLEQEKKELETSSKQETKKPREYIEHVQTSKRGVDVTRKESPSIAAQALQKST